MSHEWPAYPQQGGYPGFPNPFATFAGELSRFVGRRVRVVTDCRTFTGRLIEVGFDFLRLRKQGRIILVRNSRICEVEVLQHPFW